MPKLRDFGAEKDAEGVWHVPVTAIEGVGWKLQAEPADMPRHATPDMSVTAPDMSGEMSKLRAENADLRARLVRVEADADKWQAIAAERLQNLDDLRLSQRLLEAANAQSTELPKDSGEVREDESSRRPGWRARFRW